MARSKKKAEKKSTTLEQSEQPRLSSIERIATLLSELADLMRQEGLSKEALHHLRQLQMRFSFEAPNHQFKIDEAPPIVAPARWRERANRAESPVDFIRREYKQYQGKLTRAHFRSLDMSLYDALKHWLKSNRMPPDFDLPTKREMIDRQVARLRKITLTHTSEQLEKLRLYQAARRRAAKK